MPMFPLSIPSPRLALPVLPERILLTVQSMQEVRYELYLFVYSKKYLEAHREEITLHKAAKAAFDEAGLQKLPKVKELDAEFAELLTQKKAAYPDYRKARNEMQELVRAQKNVERFFAEEKENTEKTQTR